MSFSKGFGLSFCLGLCLCLSACVADLPPMEQGWFRLEAITRNESSTRADGEPAYFVEIARNGTTHLSRTAFAEISATPIALAPANGYVVTAESCTPAQAEQQPTLFGQPRYAASQSFNIAAGITTPLRLTATMANAAFGVQPDADFPFASYTVEATLGARTLTFTSSTQTGYFNIDPSIESILHYSVCATTVQGIEAKGTGTVVLRPKTRSILHLKSNFAQLGIQITYDDTFDPRTEILEVEVE